ncbi:MAG: hypothetical protein IPP63_08330 [Chloracidobacterium sp.]|nr:hypothetical protein [Chloracidobacterium sp.]
MRLRSSTKQIYSNNQPILVAVPLFRKTIDQLAGLDQNSDVIQKLQTRAIFYLSNALSWDGAQSEAEIEMDKAIRLADGSLPVHQMTPASWLAWPACGLASSHEEASPTRSAAFCRAAVCGRRAGRKCR